MLAETRVGVVMVKKGHATTLHTVIDQACLLLTALLNNLKKHERKSRLRGTVTLRAECHGGPGMPSVAQLFTF